MKILIDKNVELKKLKKFLSEKQIEAELSTLKAENKVRKIRKKRTGLLILGGPTSLGNRLANDKSNKNFQELTKIMGKENLGDVLHVESAIFHKIEYLITEDKGILSKKGEISKINSSLKIKNLNHFIEEFTSAN